MSKVLNVVTGGLLSLVDPKLGAIGQSIFLIGVGIATGNPMLVVAGISNLSKALASGNQQRQAQALSLSIGEVGREAIFGEVLTGGSLTDAFNWGGKYGTDWEAVVIALADHRCEALVGFYVDDRYYTFNGNGNVPGFNGHLVMKWFNGAEDQGVGDDMLNHGGYTPADNLAGISYVLISYKADKSDEKNPVFPNGRPRFQFQIKGKRCYQARKDSTVTGGSGPHRWNDPATWEWTDNPIDCRYNWIRGVYACDRVGEPGQLLIGRGLSATEAPPERVASPATICDEAVERAGGGTEPRYRIGAIINALDPYDAVEDSFASACAGVVLQPEGSLEIEPGHAKSPVAYITDDDLIVGKAVQFSEYRSEADEGWVNTVIPRYIEPTQRWSDHAAPIRRNTADLLSDGGPREATLSLPYVNSGTQAQRCGEIVRRMGRLWRTASFTLGPRFSDIEEGDWIVFTSARRTRGLPVQFRVEAYTLDQARQITLTLREINSAVFSWSAVDEIIPGATAEAQTPPDGYGEPDAGTWSLSGVSIGTDGATIPGLTFAGAVEDSYVSAVRFEYRLHDPANGIDDGWLDGGLGASNATSKSIVSVESGGSYDGAVSYSFPGGRFGDRLILGPVTAGSLSTGTSGARRFTTQSIAFPLSSDSSHIYIAAFNGIVDGAYVEIPAGTINGLAASTTWRVYFSRTSGFFSAEAHPAIVSEQDNTLIFIDMQATSSGGTTPEYPPNPTPPGGWGGGGRFPTQAEN